MEGRYNYMQDKYNKNETGSQEVIEILLDKSGTGRVRPWRAKKLASTQLSQVLAWEDYAPKKAVRVRDCSDMLLFTVQQDGTKRLKNGNFCRERLCPMCGWRRSLKAYSNMTKVMDVVGKDYAFIFLTLTAKNCTGTELTEILNKMFRAWHNMMRTKAVKQAVKGWYRGLEVTHNIDCDTYHPHFHVVLAADKRYFKGENYIKQADWKALWKSAMCVDYDPIIDVRKIKGKTAKAVAEVAKYSVKDADYIIPDNWDLTVDTVRTLDVSLKGRRLIAYGGVLKDVHKRLNLDDEVNGDLVNVDGNNVGDDIGHDVLYFWHTGYTQYIRK